MSETTELETLPIADDAPDAAASDLPRPRTRWAAIIWGLVLAGVAAAALWVVLDPPRRAGITEWLLQLSPLAVVAYAILTGGALLLVVGIAGLARRMQLRSAERSSDPR